MADNANNGSDANVQKLGFAVTYSSSSNQHFSIAKDLAAPASDSVPHRIQYLRELRSAVVAVQGEINQELTARMEEDKKAQDAPGPNARGVDESKEEENYGEEAQDEDEE